MKTFLLLLLSGFFIHQLFGQAISGGSFQPSSPLSIPLKLAGNFGEIRSNHFHSGVDISTNEVEGLPVLAVAPGYISRIKVAPNGYGNAIYLTHPGGFVTVYGHLKQYNKAVNDLVKEMQYKENTFAIDLSLDKDKFKVKRGDTIAYSGSSGDAEGPHLHFEIRDEKTEHVLNPEKYLPQIVDKRPPVVSQIVLYQWKDINMKPRRQWIDLIYRNGKYVTEKPVTSIYPILAVGVAMYDEQEHGVSKNGVYKSSLYNNNAMIFDYKIDEFSFDSSRYVNSFSDYNIRMRSGILVTKLFHEPGNHLPIYDSLLNDGYLPTGFKNDVRVVAEDYRGNQSVIEFTVQRSLIINPPATPFVAEIAHDKPFNLSYDSFKVSFQANTFYTNLHKTFEVELPTNVSQNSSVYRLLDGLTPCHKPFTISLIPYAIDDELKDKTILICSNNYDGNKPLRTHWDDEWLVAQSQTLGFFYAAIDTFPPVIKFISEKNGEIVFQISDKMSGVDEITPMVNGKWVLYAFDSKSGSVTIRTKELPLNHNTVNLTVTDKVGNQTSYSYRYIK